MTRPNQVLTIGDVSETKTSPIVELEKFRSSTCVKEECKGTMINNPKDINNCCEKDPDSNEEKCKAIECEATQINNPEDVSKCCEKDSTDETKCKQAECVSSMINNPKDKTQCCEKDPDNEEQCKAIECEATQINNPDDVTQCCNKDPTDHEFQVWMRKTLDDVDGWFTLYNEKTDRYLTAEKESETVGEGSY